MESDNKELLFPKQFLFREKMFRKNFSYEYELILIELKIIVDEIKFDNSYYMNNLLV